MTHSTKVIYQSNPITGDPVNHPKHYISDPSGIECIQISENWSFCLGNALKYLWRNGKKDADTDIQDLEKAIWYIQREIERKKRVKGGGLMSNEKLEAYKKEFIEWGRWVRCDPNRLSYPSPWFEMIMRDNIPCSSVSPNITDDRAMAIDKAVCALARYSVLQYQVFCMRYLLGYSERRIADLADERILRNRRNRVKQELDKAGGFIYGFLENNT